MFEKRVEIQEGESLTLAKLLSHASVSTWDETDVLIKLPSGEEPDLTVEQAESGPSASARLRARPKHQSDHNELSCFTKDLQPRLVKSFEVEESCSVFVLALSRQLVSLLDIETVGCFLLRCCVEHEFRIAHLSRSGFDLLKHEPAEPVSLVGRTYG